MKKTCTLFLCILLLMGGCVKGEIENNPPVKEDESDNISVNPFKEELELIFSSGAGAWGSAIYLKENGNFIGEYHDSDMGVTGEEYPNGTLYLCEYEGEFHIGKQIDDYSYEINFDKIEYKNPSETEEIVDGQRIIYSDAHGLVPGEKFVFYLPNTPVDKLDESLLSWAPHRYEIVNGEYETLSCYAIFNLDEETGFFSEVKEAQ